MSKFLSLLILAAALTWGVAQLRFTASANAAQASAKGDRLVYRGCMQATWPDIPEQCLEGTEAKRLRIVTANQPAAS